MWKKIFFNQEGTTSFTFIMILSLFSLFFFIGLLESKLTSKKIEQIKKTFFCLKKLKSELVWDQVNENSFFKKIDPKDFCSRKLLKEFYPYEK